MRFIRPTHPAQQLSRGFTLIELLVTIAILGILVGLATPSMSKFVADWRVNSAVNSFARDFRLARSEAIKRSRPVVICRQKPGSTVGCDTGKAWDETGWLVFVDNNFNSDYNSATDEIIVQQGKLPGIQTFLVTGSTGVKFTLLPNGLMKNNTSNTGFNVQSALGGDSPMTEQGICVSRTGRVRKAASGASC